MAITEVLKGLGSWELSLKGSTPKSVMAAIQYFGHVVIHTGRLATLDDSLLGTSRYTGVLLERDLEADNRKISGQGMNFWLGDSDGKGDIFETAVVIPLLTSFEDAIRAVLPPSGSIVEGTLFSIPDTYSGTIKYKNPNQAISYITDTMGTEFVVRGDGTLDAGLESDLYITDDASIRCAVLRNSAGVDMRMRAMNGIMATADDVRDFTTRVLLLAEGEEDATVTATADINPMLNPFKDIHGNAVKLTRIISESTTDATNAPARAQLQLNRFTKPRAAMTLSTDEFDIKGVLRVGDYAWVQDEELDIVDYAKEVIFRGQRLNPVKLRITEASWPVVDGMTVAYRDNFGVWTDLTKWMEFESGDTSLVVGGYNRGLTNTSGEQVGTRPAPNTSVPDAPLWVTPFVFGVYQALDGNTKAQVQLKWLRPDNTDLTTIVDGDHYDIRFRSSSTPIFPSTHAQLHAKTHAQLALGTYAQPITYTAGAWQYAAAPWDELTFMIQDLPTNMPYEVEIRACDSASPPNVGDWSTTQVFQTSGDTLPPATPAPPVIAAGILTVQMMHELGVAAGGTYNLDADLHHLELHGGPTNSFTPGPDTLLGKASANNGMITGHIPVVASVPIGSTSSVWFRVIAVDLDGNQSLPSTAVEQTAQLVDDQHITNLTASKITAGTITSQIVVAGAIRTGYVGARVELASDGIYQYDQFDDLTSFISSLDGTALFTGQIQSDINGKRVVINEDLGGGVRVPEMRFYPSSSSAYAYINGSGTSTVSYLGLNSSDSGGQHGLMLISPNDIAIGFPNSGVTAPLIGGYVHVDRTGGSGSVQVETHDTSGNRNGGWFWGTLNDAYFGIMASGGAEAFLRWDMSNRRINMKGGWANGNPIGSEGGLIIQRSVTSGGAATFGYGATMSSDISTHATWTDYTGYSNTTIVNTYADTFSQISVGNGVGGRNGHYSLIGFRYII